MRSLFVLLILGLVISCTSKGKPIVLEDGTSGFLSRCDATKQGCLIQAGRTCPRGYKVIEENRMDQSSFSGSAGGGIAAMGGRSNTMMTMIYRCRLPGADPEPEAVSH
jgi:hypothetical protein